MNNHDKLDRCFSIAFIALMTACSALVNNVHSQDEDDRYHASENQSSRKRTSQPRQVQPTAPEQIPYRRSTSNRVVPVSYNDESIVTDAIEPGYIEPGYIEDNNNGASCDSCGSTCDGGCDSSCGDLCQQGFCGGSFACRPLGCTPLGSIMRNFYVRAEAATFYGTGQTIPVLVSTGSASTPANQALLGGAGVGSDSSSGIRFEVGSWFDESKSVGFLVRMFHTGDNDSGFSGNSNANPEIVRPFLNVSGGLPGTADEVVISSVGVRTGSIFANLGSNAQGGDILLRRALAVDHLGRWDFLYGYQQARLTDLLQIDSSTTEIAGPTPAIGTLLEQSDRFQSRSQFHGATFGFSGQVAENNWFLSGMFKLGFGNMNRRSDISGASRITVPGNPVTVSESTDGLLARSTNSGTYRNDTFVIVPELGINLGYKLTPRLDFIVGYSMIELPKVGRVTDTLDSQLASNLNVPLTGVVRPSFLFKESNFMLHSVNYGLQWRY